MRYTNLTFYYLLTYLLTSKSSEGNKSWYRR